VVRREVISLFVCSAAVWSLAAHAKQPAPRNAAKAALPNLLHIEMVRVQSTDREPANPRLSDGLVDLMKIPP
jgi:hypothetical protein